MRGGIELAELAEAECARLGLDVRVERFKCLGVCERGPNLKIAPDGRFIHAATPEEILALLKTMAPEAGC